jgi:major membrane immunogen (membrane-anchored lipoprotein)
MTKYKETIEKLVKETVEYTVSDCITCGTTHKGKVNQYQIHDKDVRPDIVLFNHQRAIGFVSGGHCTKCKATFEENRGKYKSEAAFIWNLHNDVQTLIAKEQLKIKISTDRIEELNKLLNV